MSQSSQPGDRPSQEGEEEEPLGDSSADQPQSTAPTSPASSDSRAKPPRPLRRVPGHYRRPFTPSLVKPFKVPWRIQAGEVGDEGGAGSLGPGSSSVMSIGAPSSTTYSISSAASTSSAGTSSTAASSSGSPSALQTTYPPQIKRPRPAALTRTASARKRLCSIHHPAFSSSAAYPSARRGDNSNASSRVTGRWDGERLSSMAAGYEDDESEASDDSRVSGKHEGQAQGEEGDRDDDDGDEALPEPDELLRRITKRRR